MASTSRPAGAPHGAQTESRQLAFDLQLRPAMDREDFIVAPCNEAAVAWIDRWPDWRAPGLVIHGPSGCGKTHLTAVWASCAQAVAVGADALADGRWQRIVDARQVVVLDDSDRLTGGSRDLEETLFHLYTRVGEAGGSLLLTGRSPAAAWSFVLPDLASRLGALPAVAIGAPDDALIDALYVKLFADRQLRIDREVIAYLRTHMERSFEGVRLAVDRLDRTALAEGREITIPFARAALDLDLT